MACVSLRTCPPLFSGATNRGPSEKRLLGSLGRLPEATLSNRSAGWPTPHTVAYTNKEKGNEGRSEAQETRWKVGARGREKKGDTGEETKYNVTIWRGALVEQRSQKKRAGITVNDVARNLLHVRLCTILSSMLAT